jgi:SAM-dependent methyltransferase
MTFAELKDFVARMVGPWVFMSMSASFIPRTVRRLARERRWGALVSPSEFSEELFSEFWAWAGPQMKADGEPKRIIPLFEGRVSHGAVHDTVVGTPISGTVIEVGAGNGLWVDTFAKLRVATKITKVYGIEPNLNSAAALRQRVKEFGLEDLYEVVPLGIEDLGKGTAPAIEPGSVDCIVSILCLCSIPDQEYNVRELYKLLKPGGRWYAYEHVNMRDAGIILALYQRESSNLELPDRGIS